eukprot:756497-Hanusia_phi.AAC.1
MLNSGEALRKLFVLPLSGTVIAYHKTDKYYSFRSVSSPITPLPSCSSKSSSSFIFTISSVHKDLLPKHSPLSSSPDPPPPLGPLTCSPRSIQMYSNGELQNETVLAAESEAIMHVWMEVLYVSTGREVPGLFVDQEEDNSKIL